MNRKKALTFVEGYGRTWQTWNPEGFADLFTDDVAYVAHPFDETVFGRAALVAYVEKEPRPPTRRPRQHRRSDPPTAPAPPLIPRS